MTKEQQPTKTRRVRPLAVFLGVLLLFTVLPIIGYAIPLLMSNGTEKFEGDKKKMAQWVLDEYYFSGFEKYVGLRLNVHVEDVQPIRPEDAAEVCGKYRRLHPDSSRHYSVKVAVRGPFGLKREDVTYDAGCIIPPSTWPNTSN